MSKEKKKNGKTGKSMFYLQNYPTEETVVADPGDVVIEMDSKLLEGEMELIKAEKVISMKPYEGSGETGTLYCTTFRVRFITWYSDSNEDTCVMGHKLIGTQDIALSNILAVYHISGEKRKRLAPGATKNSIKQIKIFTKDVGIHSFDFEFAKKSEAKNLVAAILLHAFNKKHHLLFAHEFGPSLMVNGHEKPTGVKNEERALIDEWRPRQYDMRGDYELELNRMNAQFAWRVTDVNHNFGQSPSMPEYFLVPKNTLDHLLCEATALFVGNRLPMLAYTHSNGFSLVTMSPLVPDTALEMLEKRYPGPKACRLLEDIKNCQPCVEGKSAQPVIINLNKKIASSADIQNAFSKMYAVCAPESVAEFHSKDNTVYSQIQSSHWLRYVCSALRVSRDAARKIRKGRSSVVVQDEKPDVSCLVACLVQILLDSSCRTIKGFQNMIQRCWVAAGHPFCARLNILGQDCDITPVFLLFLDCVYQLTVQYPASFEFSEIYLISLWDSCVMGLFREFIFDCNEERCSRKKPRYSEDATSRGQMSSASAIPSVWSWDVQYSTDYLSLFRNALYEFVNAAATQQGQTHATDGKILKPNCHPSQVDVWTGLFSRNTGPMQIANGGKPAEYLQQCLIMEEVTELKNQWAKSDSGATRNSGLYFNASQASLQHGGILDKLKSAFITSTFPFNNTVSRHTSDISLCKLLESSKVLSDLVDKDDDNDQPTCQRTPSTPRLT